MRHGKRINHLSRTASHRKAMLANMACSLIEHKRINTTVAKAKALRQYVEPLITKSKDDSTHSRRVVFSYLQNKTAVSELFRDVAPKISDRNGGYTRILKTGTRLGDNAEMCFIELVDFNETYLPEKKEKKTTRRSRRGGAKPAAETTAPVQEEKTAPEAEVKEEVKAEAAEAEVKEEAVEATTEESAVEAKEEVEVKEEKEAAPEAAPEAKAEVVEEEKKEDVEAKAETPADDAAKSEEESKDSGEEENKKDQDKEGA